MPLTLFSSYFYAFGTFQHLIWRKFFRYQLYCIFRQNWILDGLFHHPCSPSRLFSTVIMVSTTHEIADCHIAPLFLFNIDACHYLLFEMFDVIIFYIIFHIVCFGKQQCLMVSVNTSFVYDKNLLIFFVLHCCISISPFGNHLVSLPSFLWPHVLFRIVLQLTLPDTFWHRWNRRHHH